ncbi:MULTISPECIES: 2-oxo acid dehydrogenase subunit E2 [Microbacterium]|uniref:2-oxo acid dehydrogenase subunit E2 n=1 Tax=Microbacterium TaxID=33882 RepID=UPI00146EA040|nr:MULTISPECIES: 2-oxo acid dehydrogenase subunit E2 [Microbacterium]
MIGLVELDVTEARKLLTAPGSEPLSMTAFLVACLARAAEQSPEVHGYRDWCGRIIVHSFVDVTVLVEVPTPERPIAFPRVLRDAQTRSVADLTAELRAAKGESFAGPPGRILHRWGRAVLVIPGGRRLMYLAMARSVRIRQSIGTVAVTSVGMFGGGSGFAISPPTIMSLEMIVGGISIRPRYVDGEVVPREVVDVAIAVDHAVVDGAPAARFVADLRRLVESASVLTTEDAGGGGAP